eukprot:m.245166 g.245166  ORF g.245166 m.245166 type:complete len:100 (-) comp10956_c1_seq5:301-600(-)
MTTVPVTEEELRAVRARAAEHGLKVQLSPRKGKRFMFSVPGTGRTTHFGSDTHENYLVHGDERRRQNFRRRMEGILDGEGNAAYEVKYSPAWAAYWLLW